MEVTLSLPYGKEKRGNLIKANEIVLYTRKMERIKNELAITHLSETFKSKASFHLSHFVTLLLK